MTLIVIQSVVLSSVLSPCAERNGGCSQECRRDGDEARCGCHSGYQLAEDGKTCEGKMYLDGDLYLVWFVELVSGAYRIEI